MVDPGIGINAYVDEVRRQRGLLGNDAAQHASDLAVARVENAQLRSLVAELEKKITELTPKEKEEPANDPA